MCGSGSGMRFPVSLCAFLLALPLAGANSGFHVLGDDSGAWPMVLSSVGLLPSDAGTAGVIVAPANANAPATEWTARVQRGTILILEGNSPLAAAFGFRPSAKPHMVARSVED